jgi:hypothetical protein
VICSERINHGAAYLVSAYSLRYVRHRFCRKDELSLPPEGQVRDPKVTPRPGDRFRFRSGNEIEIIGVVISVAKEGRRNQVPTGNSLLLRLHD